VYQKLIDRTRAPLDLKQVKTIFGKDIGILHDVPSIDPDGSAFLRTV
jgi:hypothetical protein